MNGPGSHSAIRRWTAPLRGTRAWRALRDPWTADPQAIRSRARLSGLRDAHLGEQGVILATGPSLRRTDFTPYAGMPVIGLNRIYLSGGELGMRPDYLVCVNELMIAQCGAEMAALDIPLLVSFSARRAMPRGAGAVFLPVHDSCAFSRDPRRTVSAGGTVTFAALQIAWWMGFSVVHLLGVDHAYALEDHEKGLSPHAVSERKAADTNHFDADYFAPGMRWQLPDLAMSERSYANARAAFEADGRKVLNGTPGTRLTVFETGAPASPGQRRPE